jgi:hypothetical protein
VISFLGDAFSAETSRERKHLHFGIYKGRDLYFRGHESSKELLLAKWEDPTRYLAERKALFPGEEESPQKPPAIKEPPSRPALNIFSQILHILKNIVGKLRSFL